MARRHRKPPPKPKPPAKRPPPPLCEVGKKPHWNGQHWVCVPTSSATATPGPSEPVSAVVATAGNEGVLAGTGTYVVPADAGLADDESYFGGGAGQFAPHYHPSQTYPYQVAQQTTPATTAAGATTDTTAASG